MERFHFKIMICNKWQNNTQKKKILSYFCRTKLLLIIKIILN